MAFIRFQFLCRIRLFMCWNLVGCRLCYQVNTFLVKECWKLKWLPQRLAKKNLEQIALLFFFRPASLCFVYRAWLKYRHTKFSHMLLYLVFFFGRRRCERLQKKRLGYLWPGFHHLWQKLPFEGKYCDGGQGACFLLL
jgi:hypothetical protein